MKKTITIILMCLFAANISGAGISYHYCGNFLQSFSIDIRSPKASCCCGDVHKSKKASQGKKICCETRHKKVSIDKSKTFAKPLLLKQFFKAEPALPPIPDEMAVYAGNTIAAQSAIYLPVSPPFVRNVPIRILHQQFLI